MYTNTNKSIANADFIDLVQKLVSQDVVRRKPQVNDKPKHLAFRKHSVL